MITAAVTSFSPTEIKKGGGTIVTVIGTNFPPHYHPRWARFKVYLGATEDGSQLGEECTILTYSSTQLTCRSGPVADARRRNLFGESERHLAVVIPSFEPSGEGSVIEGDDGPASSEAAFGPGGGETAWVDPSGGGSSETVVIPGGGGETIVDPNVHTLSSVTEAT